MKDESPICIVAGSGQLPFAVAQHLQDIGRPFFIVAIRGVSHSALSSSFPTHSLRLGQMGGGGIHFLQKKKCKQIVFAGALSRPNILSLFPDMGTLRFLKRVYIHRRTHGDDNLLTSLVEYVQKEFGIEIVPLHTLVPSLVLTPGVHTTHEPDAQARAEIKRAQKLLVCLSPFDMGQAFVVYRESVLAIEGPEGTDKMLKRVADMRHFFGYNARGGILLKAPKTLQSRVVDLPTVGLRTFHYAKRARLAGVALGSGETIVLEKEKVVAWCNQEGLFLVSV